MVKNRNPISCIHVTLVPGHEFPINCGPQHGWKNSFRFQAGLEPGTFCFSIMVLDHPTMPACLIFGRKFIAAEICFARFSVTVYTGSSSTGRKFVAAEMRFSPGRPKFEWAESLPTYSTEKCHRWTWLSVLPNQILVCWTINCPVSQAMHERAHYYQRATRRAVKPEHFLSIFLILHSPYVGIPCEIRMRTESPVPCELMRLVLSTQTLCTYECQRLCAFIRFRD